MEIIEINQKEYLAFIKEIYKNDNCFKDNKSGTFCIVTDKNRPFYKNSVQRIIAVKEAGKILTCAVLIIHKNSSEMLSVGFFEALENCNNAVMKLLDYAENFGREHGVSKIVVGLDGHVNNGLGFSTVDKKPSFGECHSPVYYHDYFSSYTPVLLKSYHDNVATVKGNINRDMERYKYISDKITIEFGDLKGNFTGTMKRYTDLNNEIFPEHRYYYKREYAEDLDLFKDMRPLLKNENLVFAKYENKDIGFVLWYPDFNDLVKVGKSASALTFLKYKLLGIKPHHTKMVEIGVSKNYRSYAAILFLFKAGIDKVSENTEEILSSWILDENARSKAITQRYTEKDYTDYIVYEKDI